MTIFGNCALKLLFYTKAKFYKSLKIVIKKSYVFFVFNNLLLKKIIFKNLLVLQIYL